MMNLILQSKANLSARNPKPRILHAKKWEDQLLLNSVKPNQPKYLRLIAYFRWLTANLRRFKSKEKKNLQN